MEKESHYPLHEEFMEKIKKTRVAKKMSQSELADLVGIDAQVYSRLERKVGYSPVSLDMAYRISSALGTSFVQATFGSRIVDFRAEMTQTISHLEKSGIELGEAQETLNRMTETLQEFLVLLAEQQKGMTKGRALGIDRATKLSQQINGKCRH